MLLLWVSVLLLNFFLTGLGGRLFRQKAWNFLNYCGGKKEFLRLRVYRSSSQLVTSWQIKIQEKFPPLVSLSMEKCCYWLWRLLVVAAIDEERAMDCVLHHLHQIPCLGLVALLEVDLVYLFLMIRGMGNLHWEPYVGQELLRIALWLQLRWHSFLVLLENYECCLLDLGLLVF